MINYKYPDSNDPHIVEIAFNFEPTVFNEEQMSDIKYHLAMLLKQFGVENLDKVGVEFRNQWSVDMSYDGG